MNGHIIGGRAAHAVPVLTVMHGFVDLELPTSVKPDDHVRQVVCNNGFRRNRQISAVVSVSG